MRLKTGESHITPIVGETTDNIPVKVKITSRTVRPDTGELVRGKAEQLDVNGTAFSYDFEFLNGNTDQPLSLIVSFVMDDIDPAQSFKFDFDEKILGIVSPTEHTGVESSLESDTVGVLRGVGRYAIEGIQSAPKGTALIIGKGSKFNYSTPDVNNSAIFAKAGMGEVRMQPRRPAPVAPTYEALKPVPTNAGNVGAEPVRPTKPSATTAPVKPAYPAEVPAPTLKGEPKAPTLLKEPAAPTYAVVPQEPAYEAKPQAPTLVARPAEPEYMAMPDAPVLEDLPEEVVLHGLPEQHELKADPEQPRLKELPEKPVLKTVEKKAMVEAAKEPVLEEYAKEPELKAYDEVVVVPAKKEKPAVRKEVVEKVEVAKKVEEPKKEKPRVAKQLPQTGGGFSIASLLTGLVAIGSGGGIFGYYRFKKRK